VAQRYTEEQRRGLARAVQVGERPPCPACGAVLDRRDVPPRPDVSYVRDRVWLSCAACQRTVVVDREARG